MDQNKKGQATRNGRLDLHDYKIAKKCLVCESLWRFFWEGRHLSARVKITPGEYILRVTHANCECYQDLMSNTAFLLILKFHMDKMVEWI